MGPECEVLALAELELETAARMFMAGRCMSGVPRQREMDDPAANLA